MIRNILELKSIKIAPEKVQTLSAAKRLVKLKGFDLKEEYFELVYHPADLVKNIAYYVEGKTYRDSVSVADIKGTLHASYYDNNWLVMMMSLQRHKNDFDVEKVKEAILNTQIRSVLNLFISASMATSTSSTAAEIIASAKPNFLALRLYNAKLQSLS